LREAFFSFENGEAISNVCEEAGLPKDIIKNVANVVGNIVLGFTHINDFSAELQSIPGIDKKAADAIIFQVDHRIFDPVRGDILKLYRTVSGSGPRIIEETSVEIRERAKASGELYTPAELGEPAVMTTKESTQFDVRKIKIQDGEDASAAVIAEAPKDQIQEEGIAAPTMIHSETELKTVSRKGRSFSSFGGMFGFGKEKGVENGGAAITAQVSMAEGLQRKAGDVARTEQQAPRVVHYTAAKATEDIFGQQAQEQRQATAFAPVTKQEHEVNFEPKMVDLMAHDEQPASEQKTEEVRPIETLQSSAREQAQEQRQATAFAPVTKQEHEVNFEQKSANSIQDMQQSVTTPMQPAVAPVVSPQIPLGEVMKTPQRGEPSMTAQATAEKEPRLAEIPVSGDVIDLRILERVDDKK